MHTYNPDPNSEKIKNQMEKYFNNEPPKHVKLVESKFDVLKPNYFDNRIDKILYKLFQVITFLRGPLYTDLNLDKSRKMTKEEFALAPHQNEKYYCLYDYSYRIHLFGYKFFNIKFMGKIEVNHLFLPGMTYYVKRKI